MVSDSKDRQGFEKMRLNRLKIVVFTLLITLPVMAQVESPLLIFNRGSLWHSLSPAKSGPAYNNWASTGPTLDWPGYDPSWVGENIGGTASHIATGGFWVGAKNRKDSVISVEDWAMYAGSVSTEASSKYTLKTHRKLFPNGENYWLQTNPNVGEEVIESIWEYNPNFYTPNQQDELQLPMRVVRRAHQWSGSARDENYILYEYYFINISQEIKAAHPEKTVSDTLYGVQMLLTYAQQVNSRAWRVLFPQETNGARNTRVLYDRTNKLLQAESANYGFTNSLGRVVNGIPQGEWLAPGYAGVKLVYSSPDSTGIATRVDETKLGWSKGETSLDMQGPFTGVAGFNEDKYRALKNPTNLFQFYQFPKNLTDTNFINNARKWSVMSLGPWTMKPGDTVKIVLAEIVAGMDYGKALDKNVSPSVIYTESYTKNFLPAVRRAQLTYDNNMNHPDPPAAPKFSVNFYQGEERKVANVLSWDNSCEAIPDPDDGTFDLAGYRVYRSDFLPIGPWIQVADIQKGDPAFSSGNKYTFTDTTVQIGTGYYYSITAYDTGKAFWSVNPTQRFPETGNTVQVPPMESSIFANRTTKPFLATLPPPESVNQILVVPNPFIIGEGVSQPGESDQIQFVNVPNPSTIRIYTVRGDLVKTIYVDENRGGIVTWNQVTDFGQYVESGVYIFHVESQYGTATGKFAIVR
ncbi:MAG: hypothetical protein IFNCLDLE_02509 [Ignavibacteriaceae bacterium]|nr:hypothetical protein [Ignavibacteriaceae bacterium]OQY69629.1 MAG: hypothetical protein B6D45_12545 [Ignavibacteriales bacterium UTCHB3]